MNVQLTQEEVNFLTKLLGSITVSQAREITGENVSYADLSFIYYRFKEKEFIKEGE